MRRPPPLAVVRPLPPHHLAGALFRLVGFAAVAGLGVVPEWASPRPQVSPLAPDWESLPLGDSPPAPR